MIEKKYNVEPMNGSNVVKPNDTETPITKIRVTGCAGSKLSALAMNSILTYVSSVNNVERFKGKRVKQTDRQFDWNNIDNDCTYVTPVTSDKPGYIVSISE